MTSIKPPKPDRTDVFSGTPDTRITDRAKKANPKPKPKPESRPVDERGVVRRGPGGPAGAVAPKKRGMDRKELPGPKRQRDGFDKRGPVKPKTAEEKKFIMDQLRKNNRPIGGRGSAKSKPVMPRRGGK